MPSFQDMLDRYAAISWDRQESLFRLMGGEHEWRVDLPAGSLTLFNTTASHTLPIQWLGTADRAAKLWVWSWADEDVDAPESVKEAARAIQAFGEEHGIEEFSSPESDLEALNGDVLALVASGMCGADGYYLCETDHGAEYVLFKCEAARALEDRSPARCMNVFISILPHLELNHRPALAYYLRDKGYDCVEEGAALTASSADGNVLAGFDELGRLVEIKSTPPGGTDGEA